MYEPVLDGRWSPYPQVQLTFASLAAGTDTITVTRTGDSSDVVPGMDRVFAGGGFTGVDHWAPHSIHVTYRAEMFNAAGVSLGLTGSASTVVWGERSTVVVSDPFDPAAAVVVEMDASFGEALSPSMQFELFNIGGNVISLTGPTGLFSGISLGLKTDTAEQRRVLATVLRRGIVLFRVAPDLRPELPTLLYAAVQPTIIDATHLGGHQYGGESAVWDVKADQISPITAGAAVSTVTWQDLIDRFATWDEVVEAYPTWLDLLENLGN